MGTREAHRIVVVVEVLVVEVVAVAVVVDVVDGVCVDNGGIFVAMNADGLSGSLRCCLSGT